MHPRAQRLVGQALLGQKNAKAALPYLLSALPEYPQDANLWFCLASALFATGQLSDSFQAARKSLDIDSSKVEVWALLGAMAREFGKEELANRIAETAKALGPGDTRMERQSAIPKVEAS